jgi:histidinol-phosphate aminotransferase
MRTVSKIGLAGIRLGYAAAHPDWIREFNKVRSPYNVSVLTQAAAEVILEHRNVLDAQADALLAARAAMVERLRTMPNVKIFPSEANFVLARVPDATKTNEALKARKILVRSLHGWHPHLENCLRLTVGTPEENALMLDALEHSV